MKPLAARDKLIAQHYIAGRKLNEIMLLFGLRSPGYIRQIARRNGAPPRKNGRPRHAAN